MSSSFSFFIPSKDSSLLRIAEALERLAPAMPDITPLENENYDAFIWQDASHSFVPIKKISSPLWEDLQAIAPQKKQIFENMLSFAQGYDANHSLIWGARGMGKSSLIKASFLKILAEYPLTSIALLEIPRESIKILPTLIPLFQNLKRRLILFLDDLSFEPADDSYKILKSLFEGGLCGMGTHICLYATSNRRHLMPRDMIENERQTALHPNEAIEEKISLSDRFGLWIGFHPASQEDYLSIIASYGQKFKIPLPEEDLKKRALQWAQERGNRSGRVAFQFMTALRAEILSASHISHHEGLTP